MAALIPNVQLRAWRNSHQLTRAEMADRINATPIGIKERLSCDEERIRRWEAGEVSWPRTPYRLAITQLTGLAPDALGFSPNRRSENGLIQAEIVPGDALRAEADLYGTMELAQQLQASDVGNGTLEALAEAVDLLCRAYPVVSAATLRDRTQKRLAQVNKLLGGRLTLDQHRELLVITGWLTALLGCVHYDLGEREEAETARRAAYEMGRQVGHGELMGWAHEMSAWFALVEGRYEDVVTAARTGQAVAGRSSAMVQLTLQEARGLARMGDRREADNALTKGAHILSGLPIPDHPDHHFVFDHSKWIFYAATAYTWLEDNDRAEEHARETIQMHTRPDGTSNAPMRVADAHIDLGIVHARRGDLDAAVEQGTAAFDIERKSLTDLVNRAGDLDRLLRQRYRREALAQEFHERFITARRALSGRRPDLLDRYTPIDDR
jgi:tetratricopeptide (TPR) repeat protein